MMVLRPLVNRGLQWALRKKRCPHRTVDLCQCLKTPFYYHKLARDKYCIKYLMEHREVPLASYVNTAEAAETHHREAGEWHVIPAAVEPDAWLCSHIAT